MSFVSRSLHAPPKFRYFDIPYTHADDRLRRPAGGVNHSDSDLVDTGEISSKKALR